MLFILGLAAVEGVSSVNWIMLGDYFGRERFASLMGIMSMFHNIRLFISPVFSGWVRDQTGSYDLVLVTFIPLYIVGGFLFGLSRRPLPPPIRTAGGERSAIHA